MTGYIEQRFDNSHQTLPETPYDPLNARRRHANPALCHCAACDLITQGWSEALPKTGPLRGGMHKKRLPRSIRSCRRAGLSVLPGAALIEPPMTTADTLFCPDLLARYSANGPRYTSYPTALQFRDDFDNADYLRAAANPGASATDLPLYFHIPFCDTVCFYCGVNKIATKNRARARPYLERPKRELALQAACFDTARPVSQLHWGGGTPTFLSHDKMS